MTVVADTSWIAALRDPADAHHAAAVAHHDAIGDELVILSPVTLAECLVAPAKLGVVDQAEAALRAAFEIADHDAAAPKRWAIRRAESGLKLPDAIVLETAIRVGATAVATFDDRLKAACQSAGLHVFGTGRRRRL